MVAGSNPAPPTILRLASRTGRRPVRCGAAGFGRPVKGLRGGGGEAGEKFEEGVVEGEEGDAAQMLGGADPEERGCAVRGNRRVEPAVAGDVDGVEQREPDVHGGAAVRRGRLRGGEVGEERVERGRGGGGQDCLDVGDGVLYGDPKFLSTKADFQALFDSSVTTFSENGDVTAPVFARFRSDALSDALALDCHLAARSPAIDAGDPTSDWRLEPKPNGRRVNMGYYGNTSEATKSGQSFMIIIR